MIERLGVDTNAMIEFLRPERPDPPPLRTAQKIFVPLPVLGELFAGAYASAKRETNLPPIDRLLATASVLRPDEDTARIYGQLRARLSLENIRTSKMNDVWIAALCVQHELPLLTNDRGFDSFTDLHVVHW